MKAFMETEIRFTDDIFKVEDRPVFVGNPLMSLFVWYFMELHII